MTVKKLAFGLLSGSPFSSIGFQLTRPVTTRDGEETTSSSDPMSRRLDLLSPGGFAAASVRGLLTLP